MQKVAFTLALGLFVVSMASAASGGITPLESAVRVPTDASPGERSYILEGCYQCHGYEGQGSILSGPSLVPMRLSSSAFRAYVRNPMRTMPPYSHEILAEAELASIEEYVRSLPQPRPIRDIPGLARFALTQEKTKLPKPIVTKTPERDEAISDTRGAAIYRDHCAACHGQELEGGLAPVLSDQVHRLVRAAG